MICKRCQRRISKGLSDTKLNKTSAEEVHHESVTELCEAITAKCYLCTRIQTGFDAERWSSFRSQSHTDTFPIYSYIVRRSSAATNSWLFSFSNKALVDDPLHVGLGFDLVEVSDKVINEWLDPASVLDDCLKGSTLGTGDPETIDLARFWINDCVLNHEKCRNLYKADVKGEFLPTRLIDLLPTGCPPEYWRVIETRTALIGVPTEYATISHRWGHNEPLKLCRETEAQFKKGMHVSSLPVKYQHAVSVAKTLKIRYLWIDSICIEQDPDRLDIQVEASRMADVYANGVFNISALTARSDGIFTKRLPGVHCPQARCITKRDYSFGKNLIIQDLFIWESQVLNLPLSQRGWVLQEQILARRTLYFGQYQLLFKCYSGTACETHPYAARMQYKPSFDGLEFNTRPSLFGQMVHITQRWATNPTVALSLDGFSEREVTTIHRLWPNLKNNEGQDNLFFTQWYNFVNEYTRCALTNPMDKLLAIAGISSLFTKLVCDKYLAGMFFRSLPGALLWVCVGEGEADANSDVVITRAPSWTWAATDDEVVTHMNEEELALTFVEDYDIEPLIHNRQRDDDESGRGFVPNEFGIIKSGTLRLKGPLLRVVFSGNKPWLAGLEHEKPTRCQTSFHPGRPLDPEAAYQALFLTIQFGNPSRKTGLLRTIFRGLVLKAASSGWPRSSRLSGNDADFVRHATFYLQWLSPSRDIKPIWMPEQWSLWDQSTDRKVSYGPEAEFLNTVYLH